MRAFELWHSFKVVFFVLSAVSLLAGCQTVNTELAMLFGEAPMPPVAAALSESSDDTPKFFVELRENGRKPELVQFPLSEPQYIQQALDQSGASRRFRRMKVELYRRLPQGGGHRLDIAFDRTNHL